MSQQRDTYAAGSPPRTPPSQTSTFRPKRGYTRPSIRDAFPDTAAALDNAPRASESGDERDPHDLSLSPNHAARTSIVDNMLLSLDQFAPASSVLDDYRLFNSAFETDSTSGRYRGHTFSSSMSSEADFGYDDGSSRYATMTAKGRRSNSSSNHQTAPRRMGSTRGDAMSTRSGTGTMPRSNDIRKGSKGSTSTADYTYTMPRGRADSGGMDRHRRSESFDCGPQKFMPHTDVDASQDYLYDDEAAPTPSVPAGPRKLHDYRTPTAPASRTPAASRRNSVKSAQAPQVRKARPENIGTSTLKGWDSEFQPSGDTDLDMPPAMPATLDPPAPSPTISYNKPAFPQPEPTAMATTTVITATNSNSNNSANTPKEPARPGFFRRVFGAGKNSSPVPAESPTSNTNDVSVQEVEQKDSPGATATLRTRRQQPPPKSSAGAPPSTRDGPPHLVKQKSSFFRRRKKSVVDNVPPPITLPQELASNALDYMKPEPSPVSSLRQVMNPYIADGTPVNPEAREGSKLAREALSLETQKPRESVSAPGGPSKAKPSLQPPTSSRGQDRSPLAGGRGTTDNTPKSSDAESYATADSPLQEKSTNPASPAMLSPVAEAFPRNLKVSTKSDVSQDNLAGPKKLTLLPADNNVPESPAASEVSHYQTASNTPVIESEEPKAIADEEDKMDGPGEAVEDGHSATDREQAQKLYDSQDEVVGNDPAAAWLGDPDRATIREAYMRLFNWSNMNILAALRGLCQRLVLKGETQQVDRVLDAFSTRWCDCNPSHGFKATDVVHTICYSILLLNTDLHLADIESKMTKSQFVRNTMPTIHRVAMDAAPEGFETLRPVNRSKTASSNPDSTPTPTSARSPTFPSDIGRSSLDGEKTTDTDAGPLVSTPFTGTVRAWEQQVEAVLKEFYTSIQKERLPLHGAQPQPEKEISRMSSNNFLGPTSSLLRRSPSTISKSGSDIFPRGRSADSRHGAARWSSKPRSRGARLYPPSMMGSSRTSLDDQSSVWSPTASSTWSKYSLGKFTSASVDSFGSDFPRGEYQQSIGFANALSQAIIREDSATSIYSFDEPERTTPLLEDETLALAGAPWAKEGSVKHKHHLDAVDKRAKDRNWNECFAVIQQGWMRLFSFSNASKSMRMKAKQRGGVVVGGGNWTENAEEIWKFMLRQTIASALPSPGYSKSRPHVWALSLPTGAVHLFQAGTPEIVREFVSTANYWSARLSKQPLVGGISNIEYGWSDAIINSALINSDNHNQNRSPPPSSGTAGPAPRASIQSSIRSSIDHQGTIRPKLPADRVNISDWSPPQQSMVASNLTEEVQLKALQSYVKNVEDDLQRHNELRPAMNLAFSPRHPNSSKAMANWERKSSYLLREIVKFRTYIDSLRNAINSKVKIFAESNNYNRPDGEDVAVDGEKEEEKEEQKTPVSA